MTTTTILSLRICFFVSGFSQTLTIHGQHGKRGDHLYSSLSPPPALEDSDVFLRHYTWDDYKVFLIASLAITRLVPFRFTILVNYHLIDWWWNVDFCLIARWCQFRFLHKTIWCRKMVDFNSHQLHLLYHKQTVKASALVTPFENLFTSLIVQINLTIRNKGSLQRKNAKENPQK